MGPADVEAAAVDRTDVQLGAAGRAAADVPEALAATLAADVDLTATDVCTIYACVLTLAAGDHHHHHHHHHHLYWILTERSKQHEENKKETSKNMLMRSLCELVRLFVCVGVCDQDNWKKFLSDFGRIFRRVVLSDREELISFLETLDELGLKRLAVLLAACPLIKSVRG